MQPLPRFSLQVFLVCLAALVLEVSYTRIFSYKLYYYFAFMVIGFSLLGIGAGGTAVAVSSWLRKIDDETVIRNTTLAAALITAVGYLGIAVLPTDVLTMASDPVELLKLAGLCGALFLIFACIGVMLATIFGRRASDVGRLYAVDLVGAAMGCALAVPLMKALTPPGAVFAAAALIALASSLVASDDEGGVAGRGAAGRANAGRDTAGRANTGGATAVRAAAGALALCCTIAAAWPALLPTIVTDTVKYSRQITDPRAVHWTAWSPIFRIDVTDPPGGGDRNLMILHDGLLGSTLQKFDGDHSKLSRMDGDPRRLPFTLVPKDPRVMVIGAAGGHEVLASLHYGAAHVTGVELNPETVRVLKGPFAEYTGRIAFDPRVQIVNGDGRSYVEAHQDKSWDIIFYVAPDSYASMNAAASGAFVLSESYLYTAEAIGSAFDALSDDGVVCMQFGEFYFDAKPNRTLRYLTTARAALESRGIADFASHVRVVYAEAGPFSSTTTILSKRPLTPADTGAFLAHVASMEKSRTVYGGRAGASDERLRSVVEMDAPTLDGFLTSYPYDVSSVHDDSPFFWHFARFRHLLGGRNTAQSADNPEIEDSVGERVLLRMLGVSVVFAALFLLLPFVSLGSVWRELPAKGRSLAYFALLGLGFMFLEISLIQRLTLLLGYPTYSLAVTLMTLLLTAGVGSAISERLVAQRDRAAMWMLAATALCTLFYALALPPLVRAMADASEPAKIAVAMAVLAPLGLTLGGYMPLGLRTVGAMTTHSREYIAWAWAVNGFFSVISSVLTTILSMAMGFTAVLFLAVATYAAAVLTLRTLPAPGRSEG